MAEKPKSTSDTNDPQPDVETPSEIATQSAAVQAEPEERAAAMAEENASTTITDTGNKERQAKEDRAAQMAAENAATTTPSSDEDTAKEREERAAAMAEENAATLTPTS